MLPAFILCENLCFVNAVKVYRFYVWSLCNLFLRFFPIFPRIGAPLDSRPQALHLIRPVFRSDCRRAPSDFAAAALPVLLAIRSLLALATFVFACLFLFVSLGMLSMGHWCFALSLQGLALRFFVFWLSPLSARQNVP